MHICVDRWRHNFSFLLFFHSQVAVAKPNMKGWTVDGSAVCSKQKSLFCLRFLLTSPPLWWIAVLTRWCGVVTFASVFTVILSPRCFFVALTAHAVFYEFFVFSTLFQDLTGAMTFAYMLGNEVFKQKYCVFTVMLLQRIIATKLDKKGAWHVLLIFTMRPAPFSYAWEASTCSATSWFYQNRCFLQSKWARRCRKVQYSHAFWHIQNFSMRRSVDSLWGSCLELH